MACVAVLTACVARRICLCRHQQSISLKAKRGHTVVAMVGDGATDLETKGEGGADVFVGFGGVVERSTVKAHADIFTYDFVALTEAVDGTAA